MLKKLLKYELNATARIFLPLFGAVLLMALINKIFAPLSSESMKAPQIISFLLYLIVVVGTCVMALVVMIQRFYRSLLGDEGYLMFTLPVRTSQHIIVKLLISVMWSFLSALVSFISIMIIVPDNKGFNEVLPAIGDAFKRLHETYGATAFLYEFEFLVALILGSFASILMVYASIAVGHLSNRHKLLVSFGVFVGLSTVSQILFAVMAYIWGNSMLVQGRQIEFVEFEAVGVTNEMIMGMHSIMLFVILFTGILAAGFYYVTNTILKNRLNLE